MAVALDAATVQRLDRVLAVDRAREPLAEAASRRLGVESWMLTFDERGRLRAATVLGAGPTLQLPSPPPPPPPPPRHPLDRTFPLPAGGALARLAGGPAATGRQLADLALRVEDPELRAEAARAILDAAMRDPALERTIVDALADADDGALAGLVAALAGDAAEGLVALVADRARGRPLGVRATGVLRRLRGR